MSDGSTKDYGFGQKNQWRRTLWNEIIRRTDGREKSELILYLAGPQDHDRRVAVSKGVPAENLVAIDRCSDNVASIRAEGGAAICADAIEVLRAWPRDRPVCAIVLDFCSGLMNEKSNLRLYYLLSGHPALKNAVVAINFMRGRDGGKEAERLRGLWSEAAARSKAVAAGKVSALHRGMAFISGYCLHLGSAALRSGTPLWKVSGFIAGFWARTRPLPYSYKSGSLAFDSIVFSPISEGLRLAGEDPIRLIARVDPKDPSVSRKISATLAIRTMRMKAV